MKIIGKIRAKSERLYDESPVTIAFLGDSVTQGCFEVYQTGEQSITTAFDPDEAYCMKVRKIFSTLYPNVPVNIINGGSNGGDTEAAYNRLDRDVLRYNPDLTVVCLGLNDCTYGENRVDDYRNNLTRILTRLKNAGGEVIFMTPNCMNTNVSYHIKEEFFASLAENAMKLQNSGVFDKYMDAARGVCKELDIPVCDCYAKWKLLMDNGVDVTALLSNHINHPTREMTWMFAAELVKTMFEE